MARKLNVTRSVVAGGVASLGVAALASGVLLSPAQAADSNTNSAPDLNGQMGPMGDHGHGMRGGHMMQAQYGEPVSSERTIKQSDGTIVVERSVNGTVSAVSATSITITTADSKDFVFVVDSSSTVSREHATAAIADVVVGDWAHVSGTVVSGTATAVTIHAETAATHAAEDAARAADDADDDSTTPDTSTPLPTDPNTTAPTTGDVDGDGDGPHGMGGGMGHGMGGGDADGDGPHGMGGGKGHGMRMNGPGHSMDAAARGELISEISVFKQTDGTFITVEEFAGTVSAISGNSVTIDLADATSATYDITGATVVRDRATATAADVVVGDHVRIEGTLSGDTLTVKNVDAISIAEWTAHQAQEVAPTPTTSATTSSFSTTSVLKTKKTAIATTKAAKKAAKAVKAKKSKSKKVKSTSSQKKSTKKSSKKSRHS